MSYDQRQGHGSKKRLRAGLRSFRTQLNDVLLFNPPGVQEVFDCSIIVKYVNKIHSFYCAVGNTSFLESALRRSCHVAQVKS